MFCSDLNRKEIQKRGDICGNGKPLQYYSCLEKFQRQWNLAGCSPWGIKELDRTEHKCVHTWMIHFAVWHRELYSMELYSPLLCGDLNEKEVPKRGDICITDSLCCKQKLTHKATILQKINIFFKKEQLENGTMYPSTPPHLSLASKTEVSFTH